ncbi:hypothetical protein V2J09_013480 [Rumex salicifolius]
MEKISSVFFALIVITSASIEPSSFDDDTDYPTTPPPPAAPCNSYDKNILVQMKQAFNNSDIFNTWIPDTDCCNGWDFVGCDPTTGRVNTLNFFGNSPWGRHDLPTIFPSIVGNLTYLTNLLYKNNASGPIPASLANLKRLSYLELSDNRLCGPIPQFIASFRDLSVLALGNNQLTGSIPAQLSQLPNLNVISIFNNKLTGPIPGGLFSQFKDPYNNGAYLMLKSNKLSGSIPKSFAQIKFRRLDLNDNKLEGDASFLFGKDKWLWYLDLSMNRFSFNMTNLEVNSDIITLLLNNNKLFGGLPASLVGVTGLSYFNVSNNRLCGHIPVGGRVQQFDTSAFSGNKCLCGTPLPPCT